MRIGLLMPPRVWKCLLAVGMLFCLGAQAAEKRNLDDIRSALADAWLRVRISPKLPRRPVFPDAPTKMPAAPDGYPRELREAALEYERVRAPFLALQKGNIDFQTIARITGSSWSDR
jgi:hypothetical protein